MQNVLLAYIGHVRLDGWTSLPTAHPFTLLLKRALEDDGDALLCELPFIVTPPPTAGQSSPLSEEVFPKWWLAADVTSSEWKQFDLGEHICRYYDEIHQVCDLRRLELFSV